MGMGMGAPGDAARRGSSHASGSGSGSASASGGPSSGTQATTGTGHKIAFDPQDLETRDEELEQPLLTLMEEIILLGIKDKSGLLSFWNDNISYTLRGCIVMELALRGRIAVIRDPNRRRFPLADRYIEVVDDRMTGEVLLDEALKMMKVSERMSIGSWVDLMSGETWNVMKIGYQLKQVRERLAKGLVDKGVLRTEKKNFLLFDMATHPVADPTMKEEVLRRVLNLLASRTAAVHSSSTYPETVKYRTIRAVCMVCAAYAANVLENALVHLSYDAREQGFTKCDELLQEFSQWPFGRVTTGPVVVGQSHTTANSDATAGANLAEITRLAKNEASQGNELHLEIVAGVVSILARMDSLL